MQLIKWEKIRTEIECAKDIETLTAMKNKLRAYQILAEQSKQSQEVQSKIAIYKARADRKCGEWLQVNVKHEGAGGLRKSKCPNCNGYGYVDANKEYICPMCDGTKKIELGNNSLPNLNSIGITKNESSRLQKIAAIPEDKFEDILQEAEVETKKVTSNMLVKIAKEAEKTTQLNAEKDARGKAVSELEIRKGDFKKVLNDIYDIDTIITDPPYPKEFIECFSDLGKFAKDHLKKDGFMAVYSGQYNLPEVISRLSQHLTYVWTFCLYHLGKKQLVNGVNIMCGWKPVLIFSNGKKKMRFSAYDVLVSEAREKHSHEWQQSESGVFQLIEIFSKPKELVVDPFAGSGTFLKVAIDNGRRAIGADIK
jgi:hypothetical protein